MKLKYAILTTLAAGVMLSACATSNISYKKEHLLVQMNATALQLHGKQLSQEKENYSTLFLTQDLLRLDDGSMLMYEYAQTDAQYQFEPTTTRSIAIIFDAKHVYKVYAKELLFAYQVVLSDNRILNMMVSQSYDNELQMVYGMGTTKLNSMLKQLDSSAPSARYARSIDLKRENNPLLSRWTSYKIHILPLIIPLPRFMSL